GVVAAADQWVEGNKDAKKAEVGDSTWEFRWIESEMLLHPWSSGQGPAAGSTAAAVVDLGTVIANSHDYRTSAPIPGDLLAGWLTRADAEQGLVLTTTAEPVLVKSMNADPNYVPKLTLTLCPTNS